MSHFRVVAGASALAHKSGATRPRPAIFRRHLFYVVSFFEKKLFFSSKINTVNNEYRKARSVPGVLHAAIHARVELGARARAAHAMAILDL